MIVPAVNVQPANVVLVTECHGLFAHHTRFHQIIRTQDNGEQPARNGTNEDRSPNTHLRVPDCAALDNLSH